MEHPAAYRIVIERNCTDYVIVALNCQSKAIVGRCAMIVWHRIEVSLFVSSENYSFSMRSEECTSILLEASSMIHVEALTVLKN